MSLAYPSHGFEGATANHSAPLSSVSSAFGALKHILSQIDSAEVTFSTPTVQKSVDDYIQLDRSIARARSTLVDTIATIEQQSSRRRPESLIAIQNASNDLDRASEVRDAMARFLKNQEGVTLPPSHDDHNPSFSGSTSSVSTPRLWKLRSVDCPPVLSVRQRQSSHALSVQVPSPPPRNPQRLHSAHSVRSGHGSTRSSSPVSTLWRHSIPEDCPWDVRFAASAATTTSSYSSFSSVPTGTVSTPGYGDLYKANQINYSNIRCGSFSFDNDSRPPPTHGERSKVNVVKRSDSILRKRLTRWFRLKEPSSFVCDPWPHNDVHLSKPTRSGTWYSDVHSADDRGIRGQARRTASNALWHVKNWAEGIHWPTKER